MNLYRAKIVDKKNSNSEKYIFIVSAEISEAAVVAQAQTSIDERIKDLSLFSEEVYVDRSVPRT